MISSSSSQNNAPQIEKKSGETGDMIPPPQITHLKKKIQLHKMMLFEGGVIRDFPLPCP